MLDEVLATEEGRTYIAEATTVGRVGQPEDAGAACIYLASRAGSFVTGAMLVLDGGESNELVLDANGTKWSIVAWLGHPSKIPGLASRA